MRRRHKNMWTDVDPAELAQQSKLIKYENHYCVVYEQNMGPQQTQEQNPEFDSTIRAVLDTNQIKKKIYIPQNNGVNYIGMIIGPKGLYQKRLEEETGCKILIRGKGSQKSGAVPQPDDDDEQHVLLIADN